jgi:hypothetical protein
MVSPMVSPTQTRWPIRAPWAISKDRPHSPSQLRGLGGRVAHAFGIGEGCAVTANSPEVRSDHHHANSFRTAPSLCADMIFGKDRQSKQWINGRPALGANRAIIVADVRRFGHVINKDGVLDTHRVAKCRYDVSNADDLPSVFC